MPASISSDVLIWRIWYFILKITVTLLQTVIHYFNGTAAHRRKIAQGLVTSKRIAEVSRVVNRLPGIGMSVADNSHFVCWHEQFVTLDYLLNPNISLYFFDSSHAVFLECPSEADIYNTRKFPFYFIAQRLSCTKKIVVPLSALHELAQKIGEPKCKVAWVFHMARCGSTAVAQGLHAVPGCTVISESQALMTHLTKICMSGADLLSYVNSTGFYELLSSTVIFLLKDFGVKDLVAVKTTASLAYPTMPLIARRFPSQKILSMHRHGPETANSFWKMCNTEISMKLAIRSLKLCPRLTSRLLKPIIVIFANGLVSEVGSYLCGDHVELFVFMYVQWVTNIVSFQRAACRLLGDSQLLTLTYDELQADKREVMMKIFDFLDIPSDHIHLSLEAMKADSQAGTALSQATLKDKSSWKRDDKTIEVCNRLLKLFDLPDFDQRFRFHPVTREIELI